MLVFKDVSFKYKEENYDMLKNLSFTVSQGQFVTIIGASGCGKSTVFRLINGLEKRDGGEILVNNEDIKTLKSFSAYMPQKDLLFPWRTIEKNLALPMEIDKKPKEEIKKAVEQILKEVGLFEYKNKYPKDLSGGMKQRAAFARTVLTGSPLLLLDEPFSALDSLTRIGLQEWLLGEWQRYKKTILFVTHDVEEALFLSERIFIVKDRPITFFEEYKVPLGYPRNREDMKKPEIVELKEMLITKLRQKVEI